MSPDYIGERFCMEELRWRWKVYLVDGEIVEVEA